jgi:hypothetical protein
MHCGVVLYFYYWNLINCYNEKKQFAPKMHSDIRDDFNAPNSSGTCGLQWQVTKLWPSTATLRQTKEQLGTPRQCNVWHYKNPLTAATISTTQIIPYSWCKSATRFGCPDQPSSGRCPIHTMKYKGWRGLSLQR